MNNTNERAAPHAAGFIEQPGPGLDRIRELEREVAALRTQVSAQVATSGAPLASQAGSAPAVAVSIEVRRNRVWITKGVQSFMLAYEADTAEELNWYADQLRGMLSAPVAAATQGDSPDQAADAAMVEHIESVFQKGRAVGLEEAAKLADKVGMNRTATDIRALNKQGN